MSSWSYGLIREKGRVKLMEIHWNSNNQPWAYCNIWPNKYFFFSELWWLILNIPMIIKDIYLQLKHCHIIHEDDINAKPDWLDSLKKEKFIKLEDI